MDESWQTSCKMNLEEEKSLSEKQTEKSTNSGCSVFCGGSENFFVASIDSVFKQHMPSASAAITVSMAAMASSRQPHISHPNTSAPTIFSGKKSGEPFAYATAKSIRDVRGYFQDVCLGFDPSNSCCYVDLQAAQRRLEDLLCFFFVLSHLCFFLLMVWSNQRLEFLFMPLQQSHVSGTPRFSVHKFN
ncbi:hypothetical protein LguiB_025453 [Lonicera macranthoides]